MGVASFAQSDVKKAAVVRVLHFPSSWQATLTGVSFFLSLLLQYVGIMWIQVRTMDGKETHTVNSLSRLTKVQELRKKIEELFHVEPQLQRLFYRGKQVRWPLELSIHPPTELCFKNPASQSHHARAPPPPLQEGAASDAGEEEG